LSAGSELAAFQHAVLAWSASAERDLEWRRTRDPWAILVSEVMLQQTQVARVGPRYRTFLARFPDPAACASAPVAEVIASWAGLGYNRRAVYLHQAAAAVVERHGGRLPATLPELQALPGVGPYTARAVLAFAFEQHAGVVDTNAARVLARAAAGRRLSAREVQAAADRCVPEGQSWRWNSAILDLGATLCTSRPACHACPVGGDGRCAWAAAGYPLPDPATGSAAVTGRQSRFAGSDRQGRGRLVDAIRRGPVPVDDLAQQAGWPSEPDRAARVASTLVDDGLAVQAGGVLRLP
jgi:A/G-specific adenine glycosylase